ncbi:hypothetical protein D1823_01690 [Ruegeria sp. AD91A]|uniref:hypothetical protein n=1 Tax=Ruegeria sp. AD91A TaxID=2293862 RepID=UPI000E525744|nr:hypothetical protein [Ruegeria sp. AD91A]AXT25419.1 hypothetical protein D1823_01690 [Ruegeria sp. AD91A]
MINFLEYLRPHIEWAANSIQSLVAALVLAWGVWYVAELFATESNAKRWLAFFSAIAVILPFIYCLLCNALLISLRGLKYISQDQGFKAVEKLGWGLQLRIIAIALGIALILLPFTVVTLFDGYRAALSISWGILIVYTIVAALLVLLWSKKGTKV